MQRKRDSESSGKYGRKMDVFYLGSAVDGLSPPTTLVPLTMDEIARDDASRSEPALVNLNVSWLRRAGVLL